MNSDFNGAAQLRVLHGQRLPTWWLLPAWPISWTCAMLLGTSPDPSLAAEGADPVIQLAVSTESGAVEPQQIEVVGRGASRIDHASAASEGGVGGTDLTVRPLLRTAELLEAMPGMIAVQHSGGGKANQYFLRGFNLDHGTDFSLLVDEVPMNFRTHGHGQGYLDVGGLIPEIVTRIDYRKGPYRADAGDFSMVGMASALTADAFDHPFAAVEAGRFGYRRAVAGRSWKLGDDTDVLVAAEHKRYDGPWQLPEQLDHSSFYLKGSHGTGGGTLRASLALYHATWRPTEQIPERAIGTLIRDEFGTLDPDLRGRTDRAIASLRFDSDDWRASAYVQHYNWNLLSNFTFYLDDPVNGDQLQQVDKRYTLGSRVERSFAVNPRWRTSLGFEMRFDDIPHVGLYKTVGGVRVSPRAVFAVRELSAALYAESRLRWTDASELLFGLRSDHYRFKTSAAAGEAWSGTVNDTLASPKVGLTHKLAPNVAVYANWGRGFHSNDARGVTSPDSPAPGLVPSTGSELGLRYERDRFNMTATLWRMSVSSDLIFVGDSGAVEPAGATRRSGYEVALFWRALPWLTLDANWTGSHARFTNSPGADKVPGALESTGELGVATVFPDWNAAMRVRHLGPHALTEDNSARSDGTTLINLRVARTWGLESGSSVELSAELLNALGSKRKDVDYYYASRLPGEPPGGVTGLHSRVVEPRSLRLGVKVNF